MNVEALLEPEGRLSFSGQEQAGFGLEKVRREPDNARSDRGARRGAEILPDADESIPKRGNIPAVIDLGLRLLELFIQVFAFAPQPDAIDVAADPAVEIPCPETVILGGVIRFNAHEVEEGRFVRRRIHLRCARGPSDEHGEERSGE
jgi:hypothetical protein